MKKLLILIVLILTCQILAAQMIKADRLQYDFTPYELPQSRFDEYRPFVIVGILTTSIVLEAIGDAKYDQGLKLQGKLFQAASMASLLSLPFIIDDRDQWWYGIISYICLRVAFFDPVYNLTRDLPIGYIGNTSYWDKGLQKFSPPAGMQIFGRAIFLTVGIRLTIDGL